MHHEKKNRIINRAGMASLWGVSAAVGILFLGIASYLLIKGMQYLFDPSFYGAGSAGIGPELFNTCYLLALSQLICLPLALAAAIYLVEYARRPRLVQAVHFAAETLAGVPSLVLGLFGVLVFVVFFKLGISRLAGALTLFCLNLPLALRLCEDALASVPNVLREGALALGATRWKMIYSVVIPSALPGLMTAIILTSGRIIGESAALLFTMGLFNPAKVFSLSWSIASDTLTTHLYNVTGPGAGTMGLTAPQEAALAAGSSALLVVVLLGVNLSARVLGNIIHSALTARTKL